MNQTPEQALVSVVVPIYKVESYLRQCVDSILGQTLRNIEVILVDDGSPDNCPAIVDEYAARDSRVVAIHQPNGGYGKAVNTGIARATAPYIGIIESDDWIEPTMYEKLYTRAKETGAELTRCTFWYYNSQKKAGRQNKLYSHPKADFSKAPDGVFSLQEWDVIHTLHPSIWACLYEASLLKSVPFIESVGSYQDVPFFFEVTAKAKGISIVKEPLVHYRMEPNQGSSMKDTGKRQLTYLDMAEATWEIMKKYNLTETMKEVCYYRITTSHLWRMANIQSQFRREYFDRVHELFRPIMNDPAFEWKYFSEYEQMCVRILGESLNYNTYCVLNELYVKARLSEALSCYTPLLRKYYINKLKHLFTWGKRRKESKANLKELKTKIRIYRRLIKEQS